MKTTRYGIDPDPVTVEVRMAALAAEGLTPESFGVTDFQLRHHLDPSRSRELRELIKIDPIGRGRLSKFLPENHPASIGNGHSGAALDDVLQTRGTPVGAKTPRQKIDHPQINGAIQRGLATDFKRGGTTVMQDADTLEMETIEWLWLHWLALGKLHLIAGAPEAGKTTIALAIAATISSGSYWPDGTRAPVGNVLIWTSEDSLADTIKPRLVRMGADLSRIKFIIAQRSADGKTRPFCPATDMPSLIEAAKTIEGGVALLIIDPIVAAIGAKINSHNNAETRNSLQPVVDFAEAANCAVLGISHFTKGTGGKDPIERVTGSLAFGALPRIVFAAAKSDETAKGDMPRIFVRAKSNIGPSGGGFGYDIDAEPLIERPDIIATRIVWMEPIEGTARELLDAARPQEERKSKQDDAERFLKSVLQPGSKRRQSEIEQEAKGNGFSSRTLSRAKTAAMVKSVKAHDGWWWQRD